MLAANVAPAELRNTAPEVKPVETVVLAVNDSPSSDYCFHWALEHFIKPGSHRVVLLCITSVTSDAGYYYSAGAAVYSANFIEELQKQAFAEASALLCRYRKELVAKFGSAVKCDLIIGHGDARDEILDYVESNNADVLLMGSRGLGSLKRAFLGSVGDYLTHHAHCPVLIVKQPSSK